MIFFESSNTTKMSLFDAIKEEDIERVKEILENNDVDIDEKDEDGRTALMIATVKGHTRIIELLPMPVNVDENNTSWVCWTCPEIVELLLKHGADVNIKKENGWTALMWASREGYIDIVELLLKHGAKINEKDKNNVTALMHASIWGRTKVVEILLEKGANVDEKNEWDTTALMYAAKWGYTKVVELLLEYDVNIHEKNNIGRTAYDQAKDDAIIQLLENGRMTKGIK